jgi:pimeloyl-ACP methyl ester carboxylesterase
MAPSPPPASLQTLVERFDPEVFDAPGGRARIRLELAGGGAWDAVLAGEDLRLEAAVAGDPDALLTANAASWRRIAQDVRGGMAAFRAGGLSVRRNLHLGVGFLAATSAVRGPGRLRFARAKAPVGEIAYLEAGVGSPVVLVHGLGATKASFLPTVAALAGRHRVIALDLPGFGDSAKPLGAAYDPRFFSRAVAGLLDALAIERAHVVGNSLGGRVAIETALRHRSRIEGLGLLAPSLAWRRDRRWARYLRWVRPELGVLQPAPRAVVERIVRGLVPGASEGWVAAGVDEFLRAYLQPRGRAAFYAAARHVYLEDPEGDAGFWTRLRRLDVPALFVWGRRDTLVPIGFARHVREAVPEALHLELDCGHVPQLERPRATHDALLSFLAGERASSRVA